MPPGSRRRAATRRRPARPGLKFFADLNKAGNFVPVIGKVGLAGPGRDADHHPLGLQRARRPRHAEGQPAGRGRGAEDRRRRRRLRAGDQRLRAASERREAVDGVPLLRRGPARLAQGLLPPDPLQRPGRRTARSRRTSWPSCRRRTAYEKAVFPTLDEQAAAKEVITKQWDTVVGANVK